MNARHDEHGSAGACQGKEVRNRMSRLTRWTLAAAATLPLSVGAVVLGAGTVAGAAPSDAPSSLHGTFTCGTGMTGTFVTNTGNATATPVNVAHLTFTTGARGVFVPTALTFTVTVYTTTNDMTLTTFSLTRVKANGNGHAPSTDSCTISASFGPFTTPTTGNQVTGILSGTVVGRVVHNG